MTPKDIKEYIIENFEGVIPKSSWGETSFFYNPNKALPNGVYFCTIKEKDGDNDKASYLDRDNVFRFSIGISKQSFQNLFNNKFKRPAKGDIIESSFNFKELDLITPHPIYGWMNWICILNPTKESFDDIKDFLDESYGLAVEKFDKKIK
ncbi:DUF6194 family protein [Sulfurimonas paralvinellae]|uniref:DUF6194 domain-containing protein n=1 Tax=Sulfurimonas paralvinellae TaxID=317658 RepID=A0A7M1B7E1_9BACT|nr:DUF6194 family protein [Sulfurimonas paralvinellae]QOP45659.1 hypothetical protein FM071_04905 [Sulfurimonas paralvinellae]